MGTSGSFKGKKGDALLPNDFLSEDNNNEEKDLDRPNWTTAKTSMSKYLSSGGNIGSSKKVVSNYIGATGGTKAFSSRQGISSSGSNFFHLLSSITKDGFTTTIASLGDQFKNKTTVESISLLVNYIVENSISKDDIAIRSATANTLEEMSVLLSDKNSLTEIEAKYLLQYFIRELIWQVMLVDYGHSFEKKGSNIEEAIKVEKEIKEYIQACVEVGFNSYQYDYFTEDSFNKILNSCLEIMEE
ncbi:hypothetical protein [Streptococcus sp. CSL10205-OR2]|uniref:hypothetical protein n=1 Tax=Streptococcus sp. CSL10205-OR2 TaxID=2980558 RepID=UPI0021DAF9A6|nr:hypothetical protein [Streptococcus sp. CSL10205-OR2]MCU9533999.1 hypothetical protein [Streptococcus sp. CSL10205-OR2]